MSDPWSRPTQADLQRILESIDKNAFTTVREA